MDNQDLLHEHIERAKDYMNREPAQANERHAMWSLILGLEALERRLTPTLPGGGEKYRPWRQSGERLVRTSINGDLPGADDEFPMDRHVAQHLAYVLNEENAAQATQITQLQGQVADCNKENCLGAKRFRELAEDERINAYQRVRLEPEDAEWMNAALGPSPSEAVQPEHRTISREKLESSLSYITTKPSLEDYEDVQCPEPASPGWVGESLTSNVIAILDEATK